MIPHRIVPVQNYCVNNYESMNLAQIMSLTAHEENI